MTWTSRATFIRRWCSSASLANPSSKNAAWPSSRNIANAFKAWSVAPSSSNTLLPSSSFSMTRSSAAIASFRSSKSLKSPGRTQSNNPAPARSAGASMKTHPKIIDRIIEGINRSNSLCIVGHIRPDGDCVGSQLGLTLALQNEGKKVVCWNEDSIPQKYRFLDRNETIQKPRRGLKFDCVIATDAASFERLGAVGECITNRKLFINIDHHESNTRYADLNWVSARESSTGELVFRLLHTAKWPVTKPIADCLFTAVSTDTGSFQYPSTRPGTYHVAGELVRRGADLAKITDEVYQSYPLSRARLLRHVYSKFRLSHNNQIGA